MFYAKKLQLAASTLMNAPGMFEQQPIHLIHYGLSCIHYGSI